MAEDLQKVLAQRAKKADAFYAKNRIGKNDSKALHYSSLGGGFRPGEVVPRSGRGRINWDIHPSYYQREAKRLGITAQQAAQASARGRSTLSGKILGRTIRHYQDESGKLNAQYEASRKQAKRNVAVAQRVASLKSNPPNPNESVLRATSSNPEIAKANAQQTAYVASLRSGGVGIAEALLKPKTTQTYFKNGKQVSKSETSINAEKFFQERGYDLSKPELIPNSIFKPEKQTEARKQAKVKGTMGDLNLKANKYKKTSKETLQKRNKIRESFGFEMVPIQNPKLNASQGLEYFGPTDKRKIENFKLMETRPLNLAGFNDMFGRDMKTGEIQRLKTVGETTTPEMQFFGQFIQGSRNTFDSYGNMFTNAGNFLQGKPQQPLARPPVQDQFFGAVIDSAKNTFEGPSENRASDPMGDFFNTQQKRIDRVGYGQVAGELFTEGLIWATPVGAVGKLPKIAKGFFSPTVKTTKQSKAFTPGGDFMKLEGKTKNVGWGDQIGAFFGPKGGKSKAPISQPFLSSSVSLGKGTTKSKGKKGNNFFSGSSGSGKKPGNFFDEPPKTTKTNTGLELIVKTIPKTKPKPKGNPFKSYPIQLGKTIPKTKPKPQQFFKPIPKLKQLPKQKQLTKQKQKQQFFKPIPLITPKTKVKQKVKQSEQFFKPIPKLTPKLTPKLKQKDKQKYPTTGIIAPYFPPTAKTTGMFLPPLPFFRQGGRRNRLANRKRPAKKAYTAWNVNTKQVGSFLRGPTYKKSRSDYVFKDLDARTKKAKKEKDYDYLDFF